MKAYIFFFTLPDQTMIYITDRMNGTSLNVSDAIHIETLYPEDLKDLIQNGFNEVWDEKPEYRNQVIWKSLSHESINLNYEEIHCTGVD